MQDHDLGNSRCQHDARRVDDDREILGDAERVRRVGDLDAIDADHVAERRDLIGVSRRKLPVPYAIIIRS